jgi:hypothetical protein
LVAVNSGATAVVVERRRIDDEPTVEAIIAQVEALTVSPIP